VAGRRRLEAATNNPAAKRQARQAAFSWLPAAAAAAAATRGSGSGGARDPPRSQNGIHAGARALGGRFGRGGGGSASGAGGGAPGQARSASGNQVPLKARARQMRVSDMLGVSDMIGVQTRATLP
jgi:hypothetical protein